MRLGHAVGALFIHIQQIQGIGALRLSSEVGVAKRLYLLLPESDFGYRFEIIEILIFKILNTGFKHSRLTDLQTAEKAHAQGNDGKSSQIPPRLPEISLHSNVNCRFFFIPRHHHSISSTGTWRFVLTMPVTIPFFT